MDSGERPREKMMERGAAALSNAELIAILLRTGTKNKNVIETAMGILQAADWKLGNIALSSIESLTSIEGVGPSKAITIAAAFELARRLSSEPVIEKKTPITSPLHAVRIMGKTISHIDHEECWVLFLNRANYLISKEKVSSGGLSSTILDIKTITRKALEKRASSIILMHNHPSGNPTPGREDIKQTELLNKALKTCDISLIDHIVIGEDSFYSFADERTLHL